MAADWSALTTFLQGRGDTVTLTWRELENLVGGVPASALDHSAWWSGDRPHTRAWRSAGFELTSRRPGVSVTFSRAERSAARATTSSVPPAPAEPAPSAEPHPDDAPTIEHRVLLISCGKTKQARPAPARDLYTSARFRKALTYAERSAIPWFIVSAEHGLVRPDEWLAPYERYLPDTPASYRRAWGEWVVARLELLMGDLGRLAVEAHLSADYVAPIAPLLDARGSRLSTPLRGLRTGEWLAWYDAHEPPAPSQVITSQTQRSSRFMDDVSEWVACLADESAALPPDGLDDPSLRLGGPGLYGWFVDTAGAEELGRGLGHEVPAGLVYVGQTGGTRWPSGIGSGNTLAGRLRQQHLRGRRSASTLRRTLGALLDASSGRVLTREELTAWMREHLRVVALPVPDPDVLLDLESQVVRSLDPPLNLDHVPESIQRARLRELRASMEARAAD